tara:strand:+ start:398 stop:1864 length:1467 start_codon:yes stop_codon:yes gene_type:complete
MNNDIPKVVGEGTYGCVHKPALKCKDKDDKKDPNQVSKLMTKKNANEELKEFKLIRKADKKDNYHLGKPDSCFPDDTLVNKMSIDKCGRFDAIDIENYKLLLLKDGGINLKQFALEMKSKKVTPENKKKMEDFWIETHRLFIGLKDFQHYGLIHHDLKAQNIVYNERKNRINYIDFGLMKKKSYVLNQIEKKNWWLAQFHWSFPIELGYINYMPYRRVISKGPSENKKTVTKIIDELKSDNYDNMSSQAKAFSVFLSETRCDAKSFCYKNFNEYMNDYLKMLDLIKKMNRSYFVEKSYDTVDSYGLALSLMSVLNRTSVFIEKEMAKELGELFYKMYHPNLELRLSVNESIVMYEKILENHILKKQHKQFRDHIIVVETQIKKNLDKKLKNTHYNDVTMSEKKVEQLTNDPVKKCPEGKEFNPITKRCNLKCKSGFQRDSSFKCRRMTRKRCPRGKEKNPITKRCVFKCKPGYKRNKEFKCKKTLKKK